MASNQAQSSLKSGRTWTAVIKGVCGSIAIACGYSLILLKPDGSGSLPSYYTSTFSTIANIGSGIWGGLIIIVTAIMGCIYRDKKAMISIYAAFSLVSMVVALILFSFGVVGVSLFASLNDSTCRSDYYRSNNDRDTRCCFQRYSCNDHNGYRGSYDYRDQYQPANDPLDDYDSGDCQRLREAQEEACREAIRKTRPANLSVYAILLAVSVIEFIVTNTAAVLSFIVVCCGSRQNPTQQVVYLTHPGNGQPGSVPMVVIPGMAPGSLQMAGVAPHMTTSPYPLQMAAINPNMAPGLYPFPAPAVNQWGNPGPPVMTAPTTGTNNAEAAGANQWQANPPPTYELVANNF